MAWSHNTASFIVSDPKKIISRSGSGSDFEGNSGSGSVSYLQAFPDQIPNPGHNLNFLLSQRKMFLKIIEKC